MNLNGFFQNPTVQFLLHPLTGTVWLDWVLRILILFVAFRILSWFFRKLFGLKPGCYLPQIDFIEIDVEIPEPEAGEDFPTFIGYHVSCLGDRYHAIAAHTEGELKKWRWRFSDDPNKPGWMAPRGWSVEKVGQDNVLVVKRGEMIKGIVYTERPYTFLCLPFGEDGQPTKTWKNLVYYHPEYYYDYKLEVQA